MLVKINSNNNVIEYPYMVSKLKFENPNVSFPATITSTILNSFNIYEVLEVIKPDYDPNTQNIAEGTPELVDGVWSQTWVVSDATPEQITQRKTAAWAKLRSTRNAKLSESDWTQLPDAPVDQATWATYRQALRDLPQNTTDPFNPVWPQEPTS